MNTNDDNREKDAAKGEPVPLQPIIDMGSTVVKSSRGTVYCLTIVGQVEGHTLLPDNPNLSRGTVYRNLKLLAEEGKLKLLHFPVERYDAQTMEHPHFYCTQCNCVSDLELQYDGQLDQRAEAECGVAVEWHDLVFYGTCQTCMRNGKKSNEE